MNNKLNVSYTPDDSVHLYAQWAEGFRVGFGQPLPDASVCDVDNDGKLDFTGAALNSRVDSDSTENFELGGKFELFDGRMVLNTAVYRIDWVDIPVTVTNTTDLCPFNTNIQVNSGEARSEGVELEAQYRATQNLKLALAASYTDTEFVSEGENAIGEKGARLPLAARFNGNASIEYNFTAFENPAYIRTDYTYVGSYLTDVFGNQPEAGGYGKWNLRAGLKFENFSVDLYGTNITNADELVMVATGASSGYRLPPRVIGLDISYFF